MFFSKLYSKYVDGELHIVPKSKIVIITKTNQIFNPTEEMILHDGWEVYIPTSTDPTEEEMLTMEKEHLIDDILAYDSSNDVKEFYINNSPMWLDKSLRSSLMTRWETEQKRGEKETTLWYDMQEYKIPINIALLMLEDLEIFSSKCYDNTYRHISEVKKLDNMDDIKIYNYKVGYPIKLSFNF